MKKSCQI